MTGDSLILPSQQVRAQISRKKTICHKDKNGQASTVADDTSDHGRNRLKKTGLFTGKQLNTVFELNPGLCDKYWSRYQFRNRCPLPPKKRGIFTGI